VAEELLDMELKQVVSNYKFGILYAKEGQYKETDMFSNGATIRLIHSPIRPWLMEWVWSCVVQNTEAKLLSTFCR
jgi:hypothetical protein